MWGEEGAELIQEVTKDYENEFTKEVRRLIERVLNVEALSRDQIESLIRETLENSGWLFQKWWLDYQEHLPRLDFWFSDGVIGEKVISFHLPEHLREGYIGPVPTPSLLEMEFDFS